MNVSTILSINIMILFGNMSLAINKQFQINLEKILVKLVLRVYHQTMKTKTFQISRILMRLKSLNYRFNKEIMK